MPLYRVTGESMLPSLADGDLVVVLRQTPPISRRALVVAPDPRDPRRLSLKRVVGLPGEEVRMVDGVVLIDGGELDEPYLGGLPAAPGLAEAEWRLDAGECFLLGDNRAHSTDSRVYGPVRLGSISGRARLRVWPPERWGRPG